MHLTVDQIGPADIRQLLLFAKCFPDGLDITEEGIQKAQEVGLNLNWLADTLLTPETLNAFKVLQSKAWTDLYGNQKTQAWQKYMKQMLEAGEDAQKRDLAVAEFDAALKKASEDFYVMTRAQFLASIETDYSPTQTINPN